MKPARLDLNALPSWRVRIPPLMPEMLEGGIFRLTLRTEDKWMVMANQRDGCRSWEERRDASRRGRREHPEQNLRLQLEQTGKTSNIARSPEEQQLGKKNSHAA